MVKHTSAPQSQRGRRLLGLAAVVVVFAVQAQARVPQDRQTAAQAPPVLTEETLALRDGWAWLTAGKPVEAADFARGVIKKYPRSSAAASLLIEAEIARGGGLAGLAAYEEWLRGRTLEDAYLLRRAARAILWGVTAKPDGGVEALQALAADEDGEAYLQLLQRMGTGSFGETGALAQLQDQNAVRKLIDQIDKWPGSKVLQINALVRSRSPLAIPPLTKLLDDSNHQEHVVAAAEGLGTLGATSAVPQLRKLYDDASQIIIVRAAAATGLYKMNDTYGLPLLQKQLTSEVSSMRSYAARALASQPDGTWQTVVRGLIDDTDPAVRVQAAELVAPFDLDLARQSLNRLLVDSNPAIREMAAKVMARKVATDFVTLRQMMRSSDTFTQVYAATRVLELTR